MIWFRNRETEKPLISVLLAVYNGERFLHEAMDSVLAQTYPNYELLIGFNGTIDSSREIANAYRDSRIRIFDYGDEKGKAKTLNKLLTHVQGSWICIQDDDDVWLQKKLETQVQYTKKADVIGSFIEYIDETGKYIGKPKLARTHHAIRKLSIRGDNQIANTSAMVRTEALQAIGGWRESVDGIEDFDLWLRLMRQGYKFFNVPLTLVKHRLHRGSHFNTQTFDLTRIL